jgi:hypothetical protein
MDINKYVKFLDDNNRNLSTHVVDTKTKANTTASAYMNSNKKSSNAINNVIRIAKLREVYD